jgi:MFS family permease
VLPHTNRSSPTTTTHITMGLLTLVEDRPTPAAVYNWRVYTCAMVASFASCMIGYDSAFIGTTLALPSFVKEFGFKQMEAHHLATIKANIVSVYQAGAFFGSLLAYASAFFLGRRQSLWVFSVVFMIGAGIMLAAKNGDLAPILAGRVLAGIGVGGCSMIVSIVSLFSQGSMDYNSLRGTRCT